jgi:hypothetical protein
MSYSAFASGIALPGAGSSHTGAVQPRWTGMTTWGFTGPYTGHYFFTDGTCVHAVMEVASGVFNHMSFGKVAKFGTWTGGEYLTGGWHDSINAGSYRDAFSGFHTRPFEDDNNSSLNTIHTYVRTAGAVAAADFVPMSSVQVSPYHGMFVGIYHGGVYLKTAFYARLIRHAPNDATNRTPLFPGMLRLRESASNLYHLAASIPYVAFLKMSSDMNPKDIIDTDWQIFPITQRTGGNAVTAPLSFEYALAYRRVA